MSRSSSLRSSISSSSTMYDMYVEITPPWEKQNRVKEMDLVWQNSQTPLRFLETVMNGVGAGSIKRRATTTPERADSAPAPTQLQSDQPSKNPSLTVSEPSLATTTCTKRKRRIRRPRLEQDGVPNDMPMGLDIHQLHFLTNRVAESFGNRAAQHAASNNEAGTSADHARANANANAAAATAIVGGQTATRKVPIVVRKPPLPAPSVPSLGPEQPRNAFAPARVQPTYRTREAKMGDQWAKNADRVGVHNSPDKLSLTKDTSASTATVDMDVDIDEPDVPPPKKPTRADPARPVVSNTHRAEARNTAHNILQEHAAAINFVPPPSSFEDKPARSGVRVAGAGTGSHIPPPRQPLTRFKSGKPLGMKGMQNLAPGRAKPFSQPFKGTVTRVIDQDQPPPPRKTFQWNLPSKNDEMSYNSDMSVSFGIDHDEMEAALKPFD